MNIKKLTYSMNLLTTKKSYTITKYVIILLFFTLLKTSIQSVKANEVVLDNSGSSFSGYIFWAEFLQDCGKDSYLDTGGELHDIQAEITFDFESGKITGSVSGKQVDEKHVYVYKEDHSAQGTINGEILRKNDYGGARDWYWAFIGEVDFNLHYHMEHRCQSDSGEYWESEDQTLNKRGVLSGQTWGELWSLQIRWEDHETRDGRARYVTFSPGDIEFDFPEPIVLDVSLSIPGEVNLNSDSTPFKLNAEGRDVDMIDHIGWYFAYWEPELDRFWPLTKEQSFETNELDTLSVTEAMREEWRYYARKYGFQVDDGLEITLQVSLRVFDVEGNDLIENVAFEYNYFTTATTTSTPDPSTTSTPDSSLQPGEQLQNQPTIPNYGPLILIGGAGLGLSGIAYAAKFLKKPKKIELVDVTTETDVARVYRRPDGTLVRPGDPDYPKEERWIQTTVDPRPIYEVDGRVIYPDQPGYRPPPRKKIKR